ncbi:MAG: response regulator [Desulfobacteraceae bacterium]|nr:response regulator [Desulfobacteraceae bacterium]
MFDPLVAMLVFLLYAGALFLVALWAERCARAGRSPANNPWVYALSLAVYCTAWTYYGSVGIAASSGLLFLTVYLGPTLGIILWWKVLRRMALIKSHHHITSIADFISARYDKSETLAALATLLALFATIPYVSLQLKAIISTFALITSPGQGFSAWIGGHVGPIVVALMILFTIIFGVRRLDPTERHDGMVMALAVECGVKLASLLVAGVFVTYFLYDGFGDLFQRLAESPHHSLFALSGRAASPYLLWATYIVLAMSASLFLPRQFHVAVVENPNPDFISSAMWIFPVYMLLINLFVLPIAAAGLLQGLPAMGADTFVLDLPRDHGKPWMVMLVFIGGFSAATGMIMISSVTLSTMLTNHLLLPLVRWVPWLGFLRRHLLRCKWTAVGLVLILSHGFERLIGQTFMLANIGMISFAAVFQFAPAIVGGMFWRQANKWGALAGLSAGFATWLYTLLLPALIRVGWFSPGILENGPWGLAALNPESLFGLRGLPALSHTLFWSILFNLGAYVLVSLWREQGPSEKRLALAFTGEGPDAGLPPDRERHTASIDLAAKRLEIEKVLQRYMEETEAQSILARCLAACRLEGQAQITIIDLIKLHSEVEKSLAGAIGAPAAHKALTSSAVFTPQESVELSEVYTEVLASLRISPEELYAKLDYYREKENLLTNHAAELQEYSKALELRILEQEKTEAALAESEAKYRSIFENAPEGIFQVTPDGQMISASPAMATILGYGSPAELIDALERLGKAVYVTPADHETLMARLTSEGVVTDFECQLRRRDGSPVWTAIRARAVRAADGGLLLIEGFLQDISLRKRSEAALQEAYRDMEQRVADRTAELQAANRELLTAKETAEAATRAKSDFLANMSHEIRTPMNGVIAAAELALNDALSPKTAHFLKIIHSSAISLLGIINDILDFSKIEAGKLDLEAGPFNLENALDGVTGMFLSKVAEKELELVVAIQPGTPTELVGDALRLQQVLKNLLDNAIKFTEKGGVVELDVGSTEGEPDVLQFHVRDTGVGIAPEYRRALFNPFTQADASITRKYGGTGLGLSICRQLVKIMGGTIGVESTPGAGSVFHFTARFKQRLAVASAGLPRALAGLRLLLVDDCPAVLAALKTTASAWGLQVETAACGPDAVKRLQTAAAAGEPFDLVLLDQKMPGMDGLATARRIRTEIAPPVPLLLLAAYDRNNDRSAAMAAGINGFVAKPVYPTLLLNAILTLCGEPDSGDRLAAPSPPAADESLLEGAHILVAEDTPTSQEIARAVLEEAGAIVEIAPDGRQAVAAVSRRRFDAVLMDVQMPVMDGLEATSRIRQDRRHAGLPIVAMTAHALKGDEERCLAAGMNAYIAKPVSRDTLYTVLGKLLKGRSGPSGRLPGTQRPGAGALPDWLPGLQIGAARSALGLDAATFRGILQRFARDSAENATRIEAALDAEDRPALRQNAHALRGSAAAIGAAELAAAARELETAAADPASDAADFGARFKRLQAAFDQVHRSLESLAHPTEAETAEVSGRTCDPAVLRPLLAAIQEGLENADPQAIRHALNALHEHLDPDTWHELDDCITAYEYDRALVVLRAAAADLTALETSEGEDLAEP